MTRLTHIASRSPLLKGGHPAAVPLYRTGRLPLTLHLPRLPRLLARPFHIIVLIALTNRVTTAADTPSSPLTAGMKAHVKQQTTPYVPPTIISARDPKTREVSAHLDVRLATLTVHRADPKADGLYGTTADKVLVRTYNGAMTVPAVRVAAGDLLKITLSNNLPRRPSPAGEPPNTPGDFDITNLHTHGLHVSPNGHSDNVYIDIAPGEQHVYCYDIPAHHIAGTHWLHAHRHRSTAIQLSSGMAGALIVDPGPVAGGIDEITEIRDAMKDGREKILVIQQLLYSKPDDNPGQVTCNDVYGPADPATVCGQPNPPTPTRVDLVNGVYGPLIEMDPGEIQRWRCIHAGVVDPINLAVVSADGPDRLPLYEIAKDGIPLYEMATSQAIPLYPGYRTDFLVVAPVTPGHYALIDDKSGPTMRPLRKNVPRAPTPILACIRVRNAPALHMDLPKKEAIGKYAPKPIGDDEIWNRKPFVLNFSANDPDFQINGQSFDPDRIDLCPRLGTAEEWTLRSSLDVHPVHIHVNPFQVVTAAGPVWKDTIVVTDSDPADTVVRIRFEDFPGKTVLHCHNLPHEDRGMMMAVQYIGKPSFPLRCAALPTIGLSGLPAKAPQCLVTNKDGRQEESRLLMKRPTLLVFFRGMGCPHCRRQLNAFAEHRTAFMQSGIDILAVCPDGPAEIRDAIDVAQQIAQPPFTIVSDVPLAAFRAYGCYDGRALHGVFLVDATHIVRWQAVGDEPFTDIDKILTECHRLLAP